MVNFSFLVTKTIYAIHYPPLKENTLDFRKPHSPTSVFIIEDLVMKMAPDRYGAVNQVVIEREQREISGCQCLSHERAIARMMLSTAASPATHP